MSSRVIHIAIAWAPLLACAAHAAAAPFVPVRNAQCATFSTDGALAALGSSGLSNGENPPRPHPNVRKCAAIQIWDVAGGIKLRRIETFGDLTKLQFTSDGETLVSSRLFAAAEGEQMNEVTLWDVASGKPLQRYYGCHAFALSPDGQSIAVTSRSRCVLFDLSTHARIRQFEALRHGISVAFSADGERLAAICTGDGEFHLAVCQTASGKLVARSNGFAEPFYSVAFSPGGALLATGHSGGNVLLWDAETLQTVGRLQSSGGGLQRVFFSPAGELLGAGDQTNGDVVFWNVDTGQQQHRYTFERGEFRTHYFRPDDQRVRPEKDPARFAISPDGAAFISGCHGGIIRLISTGQEVRRFGD